MPKFSSILDIFLNKKEGQRFFIFEYSKQSRLIEDIVVSKVNVSGLFAKSSPVEGITSSL